MPLSQVKSWTQIVIFSIYDLIILTYSALKIKIKILEVKHIYTFDNDKYWGFKKLSHVNVYLFNQS